MNKGSRTEILMNKRIQEGSLRSLKTASDDLIDFSSNDYLGLARSNDLKAIITTAYDDTEHKNGSTGSRLLTGNNLLIESCEESLAKLFGFESSTLFSSGYMANLAFFSAIPQRGDTIIYDEYSHACIKDGCRLSPSKRLSFKHNDLIDLKKKLKEAIGEIFIVCESIYSMDGDLAPIHDIIELAKAHKAKVIVDEAHSTGIRGTHGSGVIAEFNLQKDIYAVIYTFGKAMGIHGACIAGNMALKQFIINFSRPFIYTTAPSPFEILSIQCAFNFLKGNSHLTHQLEENIKLFNKLLPEHGSPSAIKSIVIGGNSRTKQLTEKLQSEGIDVRPILSPTVKEGSERLRICLHAYNTTEEITLLCEHIKTGTH